MTVCSIQSINEFNYIFPRFLAKPPYQSMVLVEATTHRARAKGMLRNRNASVRTAKVKLFNKRQKLVIRGATFRERVLLMDLLSGQLITLHTSIPCH